MFWLWDSAFGIHFLGLKFWISGNGVLSTRQARSRGLFWWFQDMPVQHTQKESLSCPPYLAFSRSVTTDILMLALNYSEVSIFSVSSERCHLADCCWRIHPVTSQGSCQHYLTRTCTKASCTGPEVAGYGMLATLGADMQETRVECLSVSPEGRTRTNMLKLQASRSLINISDSNGFAVEQTSSETGGLFLAGGPFGEQTG